MKAARVISSVLFLAATRAVAFPTADTADIPDNDDGHNSTDPKAKPWWHTKAYPFRKWEIKFWPNKNCEGRHDMTFVDGNGLMEDCTPIPADNGTPVSFMVTNIIRPYQFDFYHGDACKSDHPVASWQIKKGEIGKCYPAPEDDRYTSFTVKRP